MRRVTLGLTFVFLTTVQLVAEVKFGELRSDFAIASVEENLANPKIPTHFIMMFPQGKSSNGGFLVLKCKNKETDVFYLAPSGEFFGFSSSPKIMVRFGSEQESKKISAIGSSGMGQSAFIKEPIKFITRLVTDGSVVLSGSHYSSSFTALYEVDDMTADAIYSMADTCGLVKKLPERKDAKVVAPPPKISQ